MNAVVKTMLVALALPLACQSRPTAFANGPSCAQNKQQLITAVSQMPASPRRAEVAVTLPSAPLEGVLTDGDVFELSSEQVRFNGVELRASGQAAQVDALQRALQASDSNANPNQKLYLAIAEDVSIRDLHDFLRVVPQDRDLRLMFARPPIVETPGGPTAELEPPERLLLEANPERREAIASQGYERYSRCTRLGDAVLGVSGTPPQERWARLRPVALRALADCDCQDLDGDGLTRLLHAERRAGDVAFGAVTANFLRDVRCRASIPLQSSDRLLKEIARFDQEFSGDWRQDELVFSRVVTDERLLNYLCPAMPGEVLEAEARSVRSIYFKPENGACQEWAMEPIARGAPLGSLRRMAGADLVYHYRIGGNQVQLLGPATNSSEVITSGGPWQCTETLHLGSVTSTSLGLTTGGHWFFDQAACERSDREMAGFSGCLWESLNGRAAKAPQSPAALAPQTTDAEVKTTPVD